MFEELIRIKKYIENIISNKPSDMVLMEQVPVYGVCISVISEWIGVFKAIPHKEIFKLMKSLDAMLSNNVSDISVVKSGMLFVSKTSLQNWLKTINFVLYGDCLNIQCCISGANIEFNDKLTIISLVQVKNKIIEPRCTIDNADDFYKPFCLPITIISDGYGGIHDLVETTSTQELEEYFGIDIIQILHYLLYGGRQSVYFHEEKKNELNKLYSMFILTEVYEGLSKCSTKQEHSDMSDVFFQAWGFNKIYSQTAINDEEYRTFYNFVLSLNQCNKYFFPSFFGKTKIGPLFQKQMTDLICNKCKNQD